MKKLLIFISLLTISLCLSSAISIVLNSGQKLEISSWNNLSSVLNKVDVSGSDLSVNGKLAVNGKICLENGTCLGECEDGFSWDSSNGTCKDSCTIMPGRGASGFSGDRTQVNGYSVEACTTRARNLQQICEHSGTRCDCSSGTTLMFVNSNYTTIKCN